jgi:hypothetical protein
MAEKLCLAGTALGLLIFSSPAQAAPPALWDGVIVPLAGCVPTDQPIAWRATYRPFVSTEVSGVNQPSQLMIFSVSQQLNMGLRLKSTSDGQFHGRKTADLFIVTSEVTDKDTQFNTGGGEPSFERTIDFRQLPAPRNLSANSNYIKITGTVTPPLGCATEIRGVFVKRSQPGE